MGAALLDVAAVSDYTKSEAHFETCKAHPRFLADPQRAAGGGAQWGAPVAGGGAAAHRQGAGGVAAGHTPHDAAVHRCAGAAGRFMLTSQT